jgi:chromosomal replication initiation ATPase DnaA
MRNAKVLFMTEQPETRSTKADSEELEKIIERLTEKEKVLIVCTKELYDGRWDLILKDLIARLEGRPYVFKLGQRIHDDIERVQRLQAVEQQYAVKLSDYVKI